MPMRESSVGLDEAYRQSMRLGSKTKRERLMARMSELAENAVSMGFAAKGSGSRVSFQLDENLTLDFTTLEKWIYWTPQVVSKSILSRFPESPTHGDLHGSNILVDLDQRTWLIDFGRTGYGYRLRDFAELESVIALELRRHKSLGALLQFEKSIFTQSRWEDGLVSSGDIEENLDDRELYKAWRCIQGLRRIAGHWEEDGGDLRRYYLALFFEAVLRLMTDGRDSAPQPPPMWRRAHALLRAALIIRTLSE
jgi:hypothetical protein